MCGYMQRVRASGRTKLQQILDLWDVGELPDGRYWPGTRVSGVVIQDEEGIRAIDALWWFLLEKKDGTLKPNRKITCFNARNLDSRMWAAPLATSRCIFPMTGIVETKGKQSYLMDAEDELLLGGMYRVWALGDDLVYSCTVITCPPHERFSEYHDKSIPFFLPNDPEILKLWLDPSFNDAGWFRGMIDTPSLPVSFSVTPVKSSQSLELQGEPVLLDHDLQA